MARPKLLLLDEPSMGLAPIFVEKIFEIIVEINAQGTPILLVEQNALMALDAANRGYVLETGDDRARGAGEGPPPERAVRKAYLARSYGGSDLAAGSRAGRAGSRSALRRLHGRAPSRARPGFRASGRTRGCALPGGRGSRRSDGAQPAERRPAAVPVGVGQQWMACSAGPVRGQSPPVRRRRLLRGGEVRNRPAVAERVEERAVRAPASGARNGVRAGGARSRCRPRRLERRRARAAVRARALRSRPSVG